MTTKKGTHPTNQRTIDILRTLYTVARTQGAIIDGHIPSSQVRPVNWKSEQAAQASRFASRVLEEVIYPALRPFEKAFLKYGTHLPDCDTWRDEKKDCTCGLDAIQRILKNHFTLEMDHVEKG